MNVEIRQETDRDIEEVYNINMFAFGRENESKLINRLRVGPSFISELSLVAISNDKLIGHILFTKIELDYLDDLKIVTLALAPMAVLPSYQNKGVGSQLILSGLSIAKQLCYESVIVLGHRYYYPKFGFEPASKWNIQCPFKLSDNGSFMALELTTNSLKKTKSVVIYPDEFFTV